MIRTSQAQPDANTRSRVAHARTPQSGTAGGAVQSLIAALLVLFGRYRLLEVMMKFFIALMFAVVLYCAIALRPDWASVIGALVGPRLPEGSVFFLLGVIGGVGGSVTLLSYGYWIREEGRDGPDGVRLVRIDLAVGYAVTMIFGLAMTLLILLGFAAYLMFEDARVAEAAERLLGVDDSDDQQRHRRTEDHDGW